MPDLHVKCKTASVGGIKSRKDGVDAGKQHTEPQFFQDFVEEINYSYDYDKLLTELTSKSKG